jgi:hypothetical protein
MGYLSGAYDRGYPRWSDCSHTRKWKIILLIIAKKLAFASLFIWFCTGGIVASKERDDFEKEGGKLK